jgi:hypothetical protein
MAITGVILKRKSLAVIQIATGHIVSLEKDSRKKELLT